MLVVLRYITLKNGEKEREKSMLKNVIAPVQSWLLGRGQCVGCGASLDKGAHSKKDGHTDKVVCRCGRIFMYDRDDKKYRRALFSEV